MMPKNSQKVKTLPSETSAEPDATNSFPSQVMAGLAGEFANSFSFYTEPPVQFYYFAYLTALGCILADKITIASQIAPEPRLYTLLLGQSADDRKSTAITQTVNFFEGALKPLFLEPYFKLGTSYGVGSAEGLQKKLLETPRLLFCIDEFKSFFGKCRIESSVLLPCVNTLFESNRYESQTKNSNISLENVHLCILAASTVDTFQNIWKSQFTDIGFDNRLFLVTGEGMRKHPIPEKIPPGYMAYLYSRLSELLRKVNGKLEFGVQPDAFELFHSWYMNRERSVHSKRLDGYALRFMPLLAINEGKATIDMDTVSKAIALCDWQLQLRKLHDPIDADNVIAKLEEKIRRVVRQKGRVKDWELKRQTHANRDGIWNYEKARDNLVRACEIEFNPLLKECSWREQ
jgi:hypothetical protein